MPQHDPLNPLHALQQHGYGFEHDWQIVGEFERVVADFFGADHGVATDCCTHALELCLRDLAWQMPLQVPAHTYMSVPMMLDKLGIDYTLTEQHWHETYDLVPDQVIDAATLWRAAGHRRGTLTCVSFQFRKHLSLGRGGMILLDDHDQARRLRRLRHDGRDPEHTQWQQDIAVLGYHYYMTPETAAQGLMAFAQRRDAPYRAWGWQDYRDLRGLSYFGAKNAEPQ